MKKKEKGLKISLAILLVCNFSLIYCYLFVPTEIVRYIYPELEVSESIIGCGNSRGVSMDYEDNYCHLYSQPTEENLEVGDVIVFKKNSSDTIIHRIVEIEEINGTIFYRTKGDNNNKVDKYNITIENITKKIIVSLDFKKP